MQTNRILATEYGGKILVCHMVENKPNRVFLEDPSAGGFPIGTILTGKVKKIIPGIRAAFISLGTDTEYFMALPAEHDLSVLLANRPYDGKLKCGDEIVVQVKKQAVKTKQPIVDCHVSFAGRYAVVQTGCQGFHVSSKLSGKQRKAFDALKEEFPCEDEIVIRTNAALAAPDDVRDDIRTLLEQREHLRTVYRHRTCYSVLQKALPEYLAVIRDIPADSYGEIVTDSEELQESIMSMLSAYCDAPGADGSAPAAMPPVRLYADDSYPLYKLYSLETVLRELLERRVWLKSGGFLVFDQTETLTAIDVNTGKNEKKKDLAYAVNTEAVPEICRQLRARNISGMILIDFINMKKREQTDALAELLRAELKKDYVRAEFIDVTGLGLFEITREKRHASLKEMV